jgi:hypothetical protein
MLARGAAQVITQGAQRNTSLPDLSVCWGAWHPGHLHSAAVCHDRSHHRRLHFEKEDCVRPAHLPDRARIRLQPGSPASTSQSISRRSISSAAAGGITGILLASEYKAGVSSRAMGYEFDALVIVLLGGVSITGGFGSVLGMFVGAIILSVVTSAATGLLLSPDWQFTLKGIVTFIAILAQRFALDKRKSYGRSISEDMNTAKQIPSDCSWIAPPLCDRPSSRYYIYVVCC